MRNVIIAIGTIWVIFSLGVPMLQSWELPGTGVTNTAQAAQLAQVD